MDDLLGFCINKGEKKKIYPALSVSWSWLWRLCFIKAAELQFSESVAALRALLTMAMPPVGCHLYAGQCGIKHINSYIPVTHD